MSKRKLIRKNNKTSKATKEELSSVLKLSREEFDRLTPILLLMGTAVDLLIEKGILTKDEIIQKIQKKPDSSISEIFNDGQRGTDNSDSD